MGSGHASQRGLRWYAGEGDPADRPADPEEWLVSGTALKRSATADVVALRAGDADVILKRFHWRKALNPLKDLVRGTRARRQLRAAAALRRAGVPVPRPLFAAERRRLGLPVVSYLAVERVPGRPLDEWLASATPRERRRAATRIGAALARLHGAGFRHRDLKPGNLLVTDHGRVAWLVDLDGLARARATPAGRARDLARLCRGLGPSERRLALALARAARPPEEPFRAFLARLGGTTGRADE
jgi:tRNA A-37 threonylcarbamoyl transferase component Bud32